MNKYERLLNEIELDMKMKGITRKELSKSIGMSETSLSFFFNNKSGSNKTINKILDFIENYDKKR